jgi:hypothetical protein
LVRRALFFLTGASLEIPAQQQRLKRWLRKFRADDPDLAGTIAAALLLPGEALTTLRDHIHEEHAEQPRGRWRFSRDRAVVDWATGLIGPAVGRRGGVTFAEAGAAAATILHWIEAVDPSFRPAGTGHVVVSWLQDIERRSRSQRRPPPVSPVPALAFWTALLAPDPCDPEQVEPPRRRTLRAEQPGRAGPDPAVWAAAAEGRSWR